MSGSLRIAMIAAAAVATIGVTSPAQAGTGCNGVVNIFVWGCAPWDNNNGAQYPYFKKRAIAIPKQGTQIISKDGAQYAVRGGVTYPIVAAGGGNIVAAGGGNIVAAGGGNLTVWSQ